MPQFNTEFLGSLVFWSAVSFVSLLVILYRYGLPTILDILEQRERQIRDDLARAEQARTEAEARLAEYEGRLKQARTETEAILEEARRLAQRQSDDSQRRAEQQTAVMLREAQEEIRREQGRLREALRAETVALVMAVAEKVLARRLTAADDQRLIDETLAATQAEWSERL
jgi:F-type H+-transporting ATPase subunit b